jgi:hypothetical protein
MSLNADVQLVFVEDGGAPSRGINLRAEDGALCGIVRDASGVDRLHEGLFTADAGGADHLLWLTPDRSYSERVVRTAEGPRYHIDERLQVDGALHPGVHATYVPCAVPTPKRVGVKTPRA